METYGLILNPMAGRGRGKKIEESLYKTVQQKLTNVEFFHTNAPGHAREIASDIKDKFTVVIVAGGDGTVHEVVNGMVGGKAALGVIPIGSGNDFIKMLSLPKDVHQALEVIRQNVRKRIDIGKVGERYFPNGLGIGFDAWVVRESLKIKKLRGFLIYLYSVLKTVFSYSNETVSININGRTDESEVFLISVGNGVAMGGGFFLTPQAKIDDGKLDICIIRALNKREVFLNLPKATRGKHTTLKQVQMLQTEKLSVQSEKGIAVHADGELLGMDLKNLDISIIPSALEVIYNSTEQDRN